MFSINWLKYSGLLINLFMIYSLFFLGILYPKVLLIQDFSTYKVEKSVQIIGSKIFEKQELKHSNFRKHAKHLDQALRKSKHMLCAFRRVCRPCVIHKNF